jgi:hypothetical protein
MTAEILSDIVLAIEKINKEKASIISEIQTLKDSLNDIAINSNDLNSIEIAINKHIELLQKQLDNVVFNASELIKQEFEKIDVKELYQSDFDDLLNNLVTKIDEFLQNIPKPKDGISPEIDYEKIFKNIENKIKNIEIPKPDKIDYEAIEKQIAKQVSKIKTPKDGKDGDDGVGIEKIEDKRDYFIIKLTNGKEYKIKKPQPDLMIGGGGGSDIDFSKMEEISSIESEDYILVNRNGKNYKIKASYFNGSVTNNVTTNDGTQIVTNSGEDVIL